MAGRLYGSRRGDDRGSAGLVYGLFLFGLINGLTIVIGLVIAYLSRRKSGTTPRSHHTLQIRTVWIAAFWLLTGGGLIYAALMLAPSPAAAPVMMLGWLTCGSTWLWFAARSIVGALYLLRNQPYPRPHSWLI
jgi:uncharacterized membrane protein